MNSFSNMIKKLREEMKISQSELGNYLKVGDSTVSQWETGKREPDYETLIKIARFFRVTTDYLLGEDDNKQSFVLTSNNAGKHQLIDVTADTQLKTLFEKFDKLSPSGRRSVMRFLEMTFEDEQEHSATFEKKTS